MTDEMLQARLGDLAGAVGKLKNNSRSVAAKEDIRKILNDIFMQPKCPNKYNPDVVRDVLYTENFDKMFFGVLVMPAMIADDVIKGIIEEEKVTINLCSISFSFIQRSL